MWLPCLRRKRWGRVTELAIAAVFFLFLSFAANAEALVEGSGQLIPTIFNCNQLVMKVNEDPRPFRMIEILGNVSCTHEDILPGMTLQIESDLVIKGGRSSKGVLDLGVLGSIFEVKDGAELTFDGLVIAQEENKRTENQRPFELPVSFVIVREGGKIKFHNCAFIFRKCRKNQGSQNIVQTLWSNISESNSTYACNTAAACGNGAFDIVAEHFLNYDNKCAETTSAKELIAGQSDSKERSSGLRIVTLVLAVCLAFMIIMFILLAALRLRKKSSTNLSAALARHHAQTPGHESHISMGSMNSDPQEDTASQAGDEPSTPLVGEYRKFPADDGLTLDMEWMLGTGSNGSKVYKGRYHGHTVAVRIVECTGNPDDALKTPREVRVSKRLSHPNIVKSIFSGAFFTGDGAKDASTALSDSELSTPPGPTPVSFSTFVVMEYCEVGSLQDAISRGFFIEKDEFGGSKLDARLMLMCMLDVARGMQHMHEKDILHAALYPKNVLIALDKDDERGFYCKIGDFCLSRKLPSKSLYVKTNNLSDISVMPPETLRDGILSFKADVYSFGIMLWTLMAQRTPYEGLLCKDIRTKVIGGGRPRIPIFVDEGLASLMLQCWHHEPDKRPTFAQVIPVLEGLSRQYAPRLRIGLHRFLETLTSRSNRDDNNEDEEINTHRYLKIRFDPLVAMCEGNDESPDRLQSVPPEICRAVWARSDSFELDEPPAQSQSIRASGPGDVETGESLEPHHLRKESQAKAHEAFVRAVDEMIQQSKQGTQENNLNEFLDALKFHVRQQESTNIDDIP